MVIAGCTQGTQDGGDVLRNKAVGGTGEHPESGASGEDARKQSGQLWPSGWGGTGQRLSRRGGLPGLPHSCFSFFFKAQAYLSPSKGSSAFLTAGNHHLSLSFKATSASRWMDCPVEGAANRFWVFSLPQRKPRPKAVHGPSEALYFA